MAFNGSGTFNRLYSWATDALNGLFISSTRMDNEMNGMAAGLTNCLTRDGQSPPSANIPMNGKKITGLANGTATTDAAAFGQVPNSASFNAGNSGVAINIDFQANGSYQQVTLTGNATITLISPTTSGYYTLRLIQDGVGSRVVSWAGAAYSALRWVKAATAPLLTKGAGLVDVVQFYWDGTQWFQFFLGTVGRQANYVIRAQRITTAQTIVTTANQSIVFNNTDNDPYSEYNAANGVITLKQSGLYRIDIQLSIQINTGNGYIYPSINIGSSSISNQYFMPTVMAGNIVGLTYTFTNVAVAGDTLLAGINNQTTGSILINPGTNFMQMTRLGDYA